MIGDKNTIPWMGKFPQDMRHFRNLTTGHAVIMGRKTFESLGRKALPNRLNIVLSRESASMDVPGVWTSDHLHGALGLAEERYKHTECFIIGGEEIYRQALAIADNVVLTVIEREFNGDTKMPAIDETQFKVWAVESGVNEHFSYQVQYWHRGQHLEAASCLPELS